MKLDDQAWSDLVRTDVFARLGVRAVTISQRRFASDSFVYSRLEVIEQAEAAILQFVYVQVSVVFFVLCFAIWLSQFLRQDAPSQPQSQLRAWQSDPPEPHLLLLQGHCNGR